LVSSACPTVVMLENVRGFAAPKFEGYRNRILQQLVDLGYAVEWRVLNASWYGLPQSRPRFVLVAFRGRYANRFCWPEPTGTRTTVGELLFDLIVSRGWPGARRWRSIAGGIAPTIVGGSKRHGGPDLGPTRARQQWALLGVDGRGIADAPPPPEFPREGMPKLTVRMAARIQGFPDDWTICGGKTSSYRQVGNAFPAPVAKAVGREILKVLKAVPSRTSVTRLPLGVTNA